MLPQSQRRDGVGRRVTSFDTQHTELPAQVASSDCFTIKTEAVIIRCTACRVELFDELLLVFPTSAARSNLSVGGMPRPG